MCHKNVRKNATHKYTDRICGKCNFMPRLLKTATGVSLMLKSKRIPVLNLIVHKMCVFLCDWIRDCDLFS